MHKNNKREQTARLRLRFSILSHIFWIAALLNALYIAGYVLALVVSPLEAAARGYLITAVPPMLEHVLMSVLLLTAAGAAEEYVFRGSDRSV